MRLSDSGNGITSDSLTFYRDHRHRLGDVISVDVRFPGFGEAYDPYLMTLRDGDGNEMRLSGCTTGYPGEGPRGTMQILVQEGWPADWARAAFTDGQLRLARSIDAVKPRESAPQSQRPGRAAARRQPRVTEFLPRRPGADRERA